VGVVASSAAAGFRSFFFLVVGFKTVPATSRLIVELSFFFGATVFPTPALLVSFGRRSKASGPAWPVRPAGRIWAGVWAVLVGSALAALPLALPPALATRPTFRLSCTGQPRLLHKSSPVLVQCFRMVFKDGVEDEDDMVE
jgi:hypothetical protein